MEAFVIGKNRDKGISKLSKAAFHGQYSSGTEDRFGVLNKLLPDLATYLLRLPLDGRTVAGK